MLYTFSTLISINSESPEIKHSKLKINVHPNSELRKSEENQTSAFQKPSFSWYSNRYKAILPYRGLKFSGATSPAPALHEFIVTVYILTSF